MIVDKQTGDGDTQESQLIPEIIPPPAESRESKEGMHTMAFPKNSHLL